MRQQQMTLDDRFHMATSTHAPVWSYVGCLPACQSTCLRTVGRRLKLLLLLVVAGRHLHRSNDAAATTASLLP